MAQYQHLPIYKVTYDLLLKVTEITRHFPKDFKHSLAARLRDETIAHGINFVGYVLRPHACYLRRATVAGAHQRLREGRENLPQRLNSYLGMLRHVNGWRQRQALARHARAHGFRFNCALTKVSSCAI